MCLPEIKCRRNSQDQDRTPSSSSRDEPQTWSVKQRSIQKREINLLIHNIAFFLFFAKAVCLSDLQLSSSSEDLLYVCRTQPKLAWKSFLLIFWKSFLLIFFAGLNPSWPGKVSCLKLHFFLQLSCPCQYFLTEWLGMTLQRNPQQILIIQMKPAEKRIIIDWWPPSV